MKQARMAGVIALVVLAFVTLPTIGDFPPVENPTDPPWDNELPDYGNLPSGLCSYCAQWACGCPTPAAGYSLSASCECTNRICRRSCVIEACED